MRSRAWSGAETATLADVYTRAGIEAAIAALPGRGKHAIEQRAHKQGLRSPIVADAPTPILSGELLERAVRLYDDDGWSFLRIAREIGVNEQATSNAILIALCPRRGFRPAERDATGRLTPESKERLRYMLKKGLKHVDIQLRLGLSAARVAEERRRYNRDLAARGKALLPPPGAGEQYCGVKIPAAKKRGAEAIFLEGHGAPTVARRTGISTPSAKNIRRRLVARLARKGQALPGCDRDGRRIEAAKTSRHFIPESTKSELRARLLAGEPVAHAAKAVGMGSCGAYRERDLLAAELAARGETLPRPIRLGRSRAHDARAREAAWLPPGRLSEFRALAHEHGQDEGKRLFLERLDDERREAEQARLAERARPKTFDEQLALIASGKARLVARVPLRRPDPSVTLGGVATGAI